MDKDTWKKAQRAVLDPQLEKALNTLDVATTKILADTSRGMATMILKSIVDAPDVDAAVARVRKILKNVDAAESRAQHLDDADKLSFRPVVNVVVEQVLEVLWVEVAKIEEAARSAVGADG